jgi:hypothetical protein
MLAQASSWGEYNAWLHALRDSYWVEIIRHQPKITKINLGWVERVEETPDALGEFYFQRWKACNNLIEGVSF